jgi:hypothetical protein
LAVQTDGTWRASKLYDTKKPAVDRARRDGGELVVKDQKGRVQSKDSHGRDRRDRRG